jgi:hypothetical protein
LVSIGAASISDLSGIGLDINFGPRHGSTDPNTRAKVLSVSEELAEQGIGYGDVMYNPESVGGAEHVVMIVGWGPYLTTWGDIIAFNDGTLPSTCSSLSNNRTGDCLVPYIMDHGGQGIGIQGSEGLGAVPRPYYAVPWGAPNADFSEAIDAAGNRIGSAMQTPWAFLDIPTRVCVDPNMLVENPITTDMLFNP